MQCREGGDAEQEKRKNGTGSWSTEFEPGSDALKNRQHTQDFTLARVAIIGLDNTWAGSAGAAAGFIAGRLRFIRRQGWRGPQEDWRTVLNPPSARATLLHNLGVESDAGRRKFLANSRFWRF